MIGSIGFSAAIGGATSAVSPAGRLPRAGPTPPGNQVLPPAPRSLTRLRPARSHSTPTGRVASAVAQTLQEILAQPVPGGGGLLGGYYRAAGVRLAFHQLSDIPGVTLTGHMQLVTGTARLTIGGLLRGALTLHGKILAGRLGGAVVRARLDHYSPLGSG